MNDATRLRIRRELAERMGYSVEPVAVKMPGFSGYGLRKPGSDLYTYPSFASASEDEAWQYAPDPLTDHEACAALVTWLCANDYKSAFGDELLRVMGIRDKFLGDIFPAEFHIADLLTSPLEARVLAACAALGISTGDE